MKFRVVGILIVIISVFLAVAQQPLIRVKKTYTYIGAPTDSLDTVRPRALQMAKLEAISEQFGNRIKLYKPLPVNPRENPGLPGLLGPDGVKGKWMETVSESIDTVVVKDRHVYVTVTVEGMIRKEEPVPVDTLEQKPDVPAIPNPQLEATESGDYFESDESPELNNESEPINFNELKN